MPTSKIFTASLLLLGLAACSGGSDSSTGSVQGLQAPQQVTIVEAEGNSGASSLRLSPELRGVTGSDYTTDPVRFWIEDSSMKPLDTVNMILSSLQQTRYWEQTNQGAYVALVASDEEGGGGERGNSGTSYEKWTVLSTRRDNDSPQIVSFWIAQEESMGQNIPSIIYGKLTVTAEPSDSQPLGAFTLYFKNLEASASPSSTDTMFQGYLRTVARNDSQSELEFYMWHGDVDSTPGVGEYAMRDRVHVVGDPANDSGRAYTQSVFVQNSGSVYTEEGEWQLQFNADYVARRDVTNSNTLAVLDRNDYVSTVYRYGVYDATSEGRIEMSGGFPIETSNGANGWAGYYGIWFPNDVTVTDGMSVLRRSFADNSTTPYTLFVAPGRLEKRSRSAITFADIQDEVLEYFNPNTGNDLQVLWDGSDFVKVGLRNGNGGYDPIDPAVSIASSFTTGQWVSCWSQARGQVEWTWPATLSGTTEAYVWQSETITADSADMANGDLTLHGYFNQLRANITSDQANFQNSESPYLPDATDVSTGNTDYTFDKETLLLLIGSDPVTLANGVTVTQGPGMFGFNCGPLFATALTSFGDIGQSSTTYQWYTGENEWNQLRTLKDQNGDFVVFDAPIRLSYTHSEVGSSFDGRSFFLDWDGANLGGVPYEQNTDNGRWYPLFNIPTGTTMTVGQTTYKIKQLEGEQRMVEVGSPNTVYAAEGFDLDGETISEPTETPYQDPAIGAKPSVTKPPKYVGGLAQEDR
ncbi:MAG: hypothetical protein H6835_10970 [Planctomycetes bacterium]|nr:hypothetical protein [Planctomycetota bacterium]